MKTLKLFTFVIFICLSTLIANSQNVEMIQIRPGPADGFDAEVRSDMNYPIWNDDDFISNAWTAGGNSFIQRSLIKFDLSSIPAGSEILSAELSLFCNTNSGHQQLHSGYNSSYLLMITSEWDQHQVVWNNQPEATIENAVHLPQSEYQTQDYPNIDVTSQIDYFYKNPELNYGFLMLLEEEEEYAAMVFASSNHLNPEKRPLLVINYIQCEKPDTNFSYSIQENQTTVNFSLSAHDNTEYWWDFGNGFYSDLPQPEYSYQQTGKYNVCLTVSNDCDTLTNCDSVFVCNLPNAHFSYQTQGNLVSFSPNIIFEGDQCLWDFGDGFLSYLTEPVHQYNNVGDYLVCLSVSNNCNSLQFCDTVKLDINYSVDQAFVDAIKIFPNPTSGIISIISESKGMNIKSINVLDMNGKVVLRFDNFSEFNSSNSFNIDLSGLIGGVYSIYLETDKAVINQKVVLIN